MRIRFNTVPILSLGIVAIATLAATAATRTWVGGNADWFDNGSPLFWSPQDEPEFDDEAVFNTAHTVNMGSDNDLAALTLSGGITLNTNDLDLHVNGLVQLSGSDTVFLIGGEDSELDADHVTINDGAMLELAGGTLLVDQEFSALGIATINAGGTLAGNGTIELLDNPESPTTLLDNNGTLTALSRPVLISLPPPTATLTINGSATVRIDLDGSSENGVVNVIRNQTLDINVQLADDYNGDLNLFQASVLDIANAWTLAGGTIDVDNGFFDTAPPINAGVSTIKGGALTQTGGTITVVDGDGTLQFDTTFTMNGGNFVNNGHVIFNADATIAAAANFTMPTATSSITVNAGRTVTINQTNFNPDGNDTATNVLTINDGGTLNLNFGAGADVSFGGKLQLNEATLNVTTTDASFGIDGELVVGAGEDSTIMLQADKALNFQSTSQTALNGNLKLESNNARIAAGATFSGAGSLIVTEESHLVLDDNATIGAKLSNEGTLWIAGTDAVGTVNLLDYEQSDTGSLFFDIAGTEQTQYDRLVASGNVALDGDLTITLDESYVPTMGNTFSIISGMSLMGEFDQIQTTGMPDGLAFLVEYMTNAVQLTVVNEELFSADFNEDGIVDMTDYELWANAFGANAGGDANGDNVTNLADYVLWRNQLGGLSLPGDSGSGAAAAAVPEPATWLLLSTALLMLGIRNRCCTYER